MPYIPAAILPMLSLFFTVAGASVVIVHLDIICFSILVFSGIICSICAGLLEFIFILVISFLRLSFLFSDHLRHYFDYIYWFTICFPVMFYMGNPPSSHKADSEDAPDNWLTPWRELLGFKCPVLDQIEIEVYATYELRPDVMRPVDIKVWKDQAHFDKSFNWVIHNDGQVRGYSTESNSSKPARKRLSEAEKAAIEFTPEIQEEITGMQLGDSSIVFPAKTKDAHLKIQQKDQVFVYHLHELFASIGIVGRPQEPDKATARQLSHYELSESNLYSSPYYIRRLMSQR